MKTAIMTSILLLAFAAGTAMADEPRPMATGMQLVAEMRVAHDEPHGKQRWPEVVPRQPLRMEVTCNPTNCDPYWNCYPSENTCKEYAWPIYCEDGIQIHGACFCSNC